MLDPARLPDLLHTDGLSRLDQLLLVLATKSKEQWAVSAIVAAAKKAGLRKAANWNVSDILGHSNGLAIRADKGWQLRESGKKYLQQKSVLPGAVTPVTSASAALRSQLASVRQAETKAFLEEAIGCLEHKFLRAAVVLTWVGAVSVLYHYVVANRLADFNTEATRRTATTRNPWKTAKTTEDLALMKEHDFLDILEVISVLGKSVKKALVVCLDTRNGCGHPNTYKIGENAVATHIETLILNVFTKY